MKYLLWLGAMLVWQLSAEEEFIPAKNIEKKFFFLDLMDMDRSLVFYRTDRIGSSCRGLFTMQNPVQTAEKSYRERVGLNLEKVDILKRSNDPFPPTISMSGEMVPFRPLPIQMPKFLCDFYETIRERAYNSGVLWRQALLDPAVTDLSGLSFDTVPEVNVIFDIKFLRLLDRHYIPLLWQWEEKINKLKPRCHNNVFNMLDKLGNPSRFSSSDLDGDTILPDSCMGANPDQNACIALLRLGDWMHLIADASATNPEQSHDDLGRAVNRLVFLIERRLARIRPLTPQYELAE